MPLPSDLPEGVDRTTILTHVASVGIVAELINVTGAFLNAPNGSGEEEIAAVELARAFGEACELSEEALANVLMAFATIVASTSDPDEVQRWFDLQARLAQEAME